jgi:hypothetical protein
MPLIERFEDIQARQEAQKLTKMVYVLTTKDNFGRISA